MANEFGPRIVTNGLILAFDAADINSFDEYENLWTYSEQLNNIAWGKNNLSTTTDSISSPTETITAEKLIVNNAQNGGQFYRDTSLTVSTTYTQSIFLKAGEWNYAFVWLNDGAGVGYVVEINLSNGSPRNTYFNPQTSFSNFSYSVVPYSNGWYRVSMTATTSSTQTFWQFRIYPSNVAWTTGIYGSEYPTGNGTSGIYAWGGQLEKANSATDYYATTGTIKNRGSVWIDLTGNGNNGTLTNSPTYSSANGGSIVFDGTDDYVVKTTPSTLNFGTIDFSAFCWIKCTKKGAGTYGTVLSLDVNGTGSGVLFYVYGSTGYFRTWVCGQVLDGTIDVADNQWHHVGVTKSGTTATQFVDGIQRSSFTCSSSLIGSPNLILGNYTTISSVPSYAYNGNIAKVSIYNRALTSTEVQQNFNALRSRFGV